MSSLPLNPSISTKRRNPEFYKYETGIAPTGEEVTVITGTKKRIRQSSKPLMNKLEQEFFYRIAQQNPFCDFHAQAVKFRLGNGIVYTPDIFSFDYKPITAWEIKGPHAFRGGFENLKVAAHIYTKVQFVLVWKHNGRWQEQVILP